MARIRADRLIAAPAKRRIISEASSIETISESARTTVTGVIPSLALMLLISRPFRYGIPFLHQSPPLERMSVQQQVGTRLQISYPFSRPPRLFALLRARAPECVQTPPSDLVVP